MRGTNGPMDVITRGELNDSMKNLLTKDELSAFVSVVRETLKEHLGDLKVDLSAQIEERVTKSHNLLELNAVRRTDLNDAKNEMLATMRRNLSEAIDPLKADFHKMRERVDQMGERVDKVGKQVDEMGERLHKMGARIDEMHATFKSVADGHFGLDEKLTRLGNDIRVTLNHHERMLDRHDADLYKLRQSGVLQ